MRTRVRLGFRRIFVVHSTQFCFRPFFVSLSCVWTLRMQSQRTIRCDLLCSTTKNSHSSLQTFESRKQRDGPKTGDRYGSHVYAPVHCLLHCHAGLCGQEKSRKLGRCCCNHNDKPGGQWLLLCCLHRGYG